MSATKFAKTVDESWVEAERVEVMNEEDKMAEKYVKSDLRATWPQNESKQQRWEAIKETNRTIKMMKLIFVSQTNR